jgi:hypothetical protein
VLSEFVDAWNAGERPDVDEYIARVPAQQREALDEELATFLTFAPTPAYSDDALTAIRAEIAEAGGTEQVGVFAALLVGLRKRVGLSAADVGAELVGELGLRMERAAKTTGYLEQLETGQLEPTRVSRRVFDALGKVLQVPGNLLENAADRVGWSNVGLRSTPSPAFRADEDAAARAERHLEVLADALGVPGGNQRDEVDDLFLGGR